jgi:metal-responsive CopG/Arc/MetJ family transcriptional regulator
MSIWTMTTAWSALRGTSAHVQRFADSLAATKGVKHAQLAITASGDSL